MFDETALENAVNYILKRLYTPDGKVTDATLLKCGVAVGEPINFRDLSYSGFTYMPETSTWIIFIQEAAPEICETLCKFVETELLKKGWFKNSDVRVVTAW